MNDPRNQPQYQVRFGFGRRQAQELSAGADVVVWADALANGSTPVPELPGTFSILAAGTGAAAAVADWVIAQQELKGDRFTVAVIAAGDPDGGFTVDDLLAGGAIVDALADAGIDYISPEAASAVAAFTGLKSAHNHLLSASTAGQQLIEDAGRGALDAAIVSNTAASFAIIQHSRELVRE
ncbi:2-phosphosulfolactate phosphatase [Salinibacterium sp. M195]|uniref:2-phosphosulfolactate phosphatase n=1 Tax=Salinibacterium sp. M195 TaxID=2583374 RepID=UPI001C639A92|nr:2-phosphosulfolactate phosphatase [Salinibacterium sp. M195]QYH35306.1 2-phosphosulfolactate phosphatase [Salinibacterium sp. M195]